MAIEVSRLFWLWLKEPLKLNGLSGHFLLQEILDCFRWLAIPSTVLAL